MAYYRDVVVNKAKEWIGKKESNGTFKTIIDKYNAHKPLARGYKVKYTDNWCATFGSAVAIEVGYTAIIPTECSCQKQIELFKSKGCWVENDAYTPSAGDYIFYDWDDSGKGDNKGWSDHVGIVEKVASGKITVIEGNCSNAVMRRTIAVNAKGIRGYGVPKYDEETLVIKPKEEPTTLKYKVGEAVVVNGELYTNSNAANPAGFVKNKITVISRVAPGSKHPYNITGDLGWMDEVDVKLLKDIKTIHEIAEEVIAGKWGNGAERKKRLAAAGYDYKTVQERVNQLLK